MFRLWGGALLAIAGCSDVTNMPVAEPAASLDEAVFKCNVEPVLAKQCSYTACHGIAEAPFRVYTPGKLRASPPANIDDAIAPLTTAEEHANYLIATGFAFAAPALDQDWLLRKPLPAIDGGFEHKGGAIYSGTDDPQYQAIFTWLSGTGACK